MPRDCHVHKFFLATVIFPRVIVGNIRTNFGTFEDMLGLKSMPFLYHFLLLCLGQISLKGCKVGPLPVVNGVIIPQKMAKKDMGFCGVIISPYL